MKKIILTMFLIAAISVSAQKEPIREIYNYSAKNDKAMIKAKTDLFWLNALSVGKFTVHNNSAGDEHLDINVMVPFSDGQISSRVRYDFMKQGYVVSLSNTKIIGKDKSVQFINDPSDEKHNKILENLKNLVFVTYQKELNK